MNKKHIQELVKEYQDLEDEKDEIENRLDRIMEAIKEEAEN